MLTYFVYAPLRMLAFRDFQRLLCARLSLCFKHAPLLVLVFLGFCRLLFGKSPFASKKAVFKTYSQAQLRLCFFLCRAVRVLLTYLCTFRSLSSPSSTCAPCSAFGQRLARDNNSATHARLSRFSTFALRLIISLFQKRSVPRPRLSRLLPVALWQVTSLQAKKQCSRRTTKARRFAVLFDIKSVDKRCIFRLLFYIRDRV